MALLVQRTFPRALAGASALVSESNAKAAQLYSSGSEMRVSIFTCGPARLKIGSQKA